MKHFRIPGQRRVRRGSTLIEVIVALFVIVIGVLPITALLLSSRSLDEQAQVQAAAYQAARQELETLRSQALANRPATARTTFPIPAAIAALHTRQAMIGDYSIATVPSLGDGTHPVQQIVVRVSWTSGTGGGGAASSVRLDSLIAQGAGQ